MNKILVTIYVVSIDKEFDLFIPIGKKVSDIIDLIQDSVVDLSNGNYQKKKDALLYNSAGFIININNIVKYAGLKNGCKLCLV